MQVAIIKYNAGNIFSVDCALRRIGVDAVITDDSRTILAADKVIFPGVGEARAAMEYLQQHGLDELIRRVTKPLLGICIGQQLLCRHSEEGDVDCLGIFDADVVRFKTDDPSVKIPHMGWNDINVVAPTPLLGNNVDKKYVYYVHSYYAPVCRHTVATTDYIQPFSAAMQRDNFFATQFHPEKSGDVGETILKNFIQL
ncbi:MAG: imidazole glycerol phosphate synthase subunit HisH [Candidatus Limisoma sp.]|nr:imidazole glycerol phosphate synthase subunit HisH [Bacteroidales bacterium]MDD6622483.1 imidazole glycerol phosphate synthase subunit HisH [Bacteroidales bacterium]MDD6668923.1 imidazole glycerol phosphate synthase subunit HisH [Bacteroidales bacterium]